MRLMRQGEAVDPQEHGDDEAAFLSSYDLSDYPRPSLTVDIAMLTIVDDAVHVLLRRRTTQPGKGLWALPGGFVTLDESLDDAVERILERETGLRGVYTAQLATFGAVGRDPRGRVVTVAYYALVPAGGSWRRSGRVPAARGAGGAGRRGRLARSSVTPRRRPRLRPRRIVAAAVERVRGRLWYAPVAFELVPDEFTLLDLQRVYEAILGRRLDKNAFRRRISHRGSWPARPPARGAPRAPAELFRFAGEAADI